MGLFVLAAAAIASLDGGTKRLVTKRPKARLVVVGIFKNEAENLPQWLDHYLVDNGVAAMLLIDNGSTDDWRAAVAPFGATVRVRSNGSPHDQVRLYNMYLPTLKREFRDDWVLVVDLDEYMYAHRPPVPLSVAVRSVLDPGNRHAVPVPWMNFGSSGRQRQPKNGTVCGFTRRRNYTVHPDLRAHTPTKVFARIRELSSLGVHRHNMTRRAQHQQPVVVQTEASYDTALFHLNHYQVQSREYYNRTKMRRGSVGVHTADNVRTWNTFKRSDYNDADDLELTRRRDCTRIWVPGGE